MDRDKLIQIDLRQVLDDKLGTRSRFVPGWLVRWLGGIIRQDELNGLLRHNYPRTGADFCEGVLSDLGVRVAVSNPGMLPPASRRRLMIVSNHPLGGLDGMALIHLFSGLYGPGLKFVVNDLLWAVQPLRDVFLPINKHGRQDRQAVSGINEALAGAGPVVVFPAGLVSRRGDDGEIRDLEWNKMFVNKAVEYGRDILPVYFSGENTPFFYNFARWRKRLGLKLNIEMVRLPAEVFKSRGKEFAVTIGDVIPWQSLSCGREAAAQAQEIKQAVYSLKKQQQ